MGITAKELARKLNLSAAAVSMALNHKPGVSTATRQLVLDAAEKYGYDFSRIAEKHTTSGAIYFVIYKKHGTVVADTPFFSQVSEGISQGCKKNDYRLKISYIYEDAITKQIEEIQYSDCAGIILLGTEMESGDLKPFLNLPIPVVLLDAYFETVPCNCVLINNVQGAYLAARQGDPRLRHVLFPFHCPQPDAFHGGRICRYAGDHQKWRRTGFLLFCRQRSDRRRRHKGSQRKRIPDSPGYRNRRI